MIKMTDFREIIRLRNQGFNQEDIAQRIGISRRSVIRYLKTGKIPKYERTKSTKVDFMIEYQERARNILTKTPTLSVEELYDILEREGYKGSLRTLSRKTKEYREELKIKPVYFERTKIPGEVMEGDFTELDVKIGGIQKRVHLWVVSSIYSNAIFATPYYNETFECFCDGSINAFNEFNGLCKKYRLDNLSPVVSKILSNRERLLTKRYLEMQKHYGFKQDFCNPSSGHEKGNVESNNRHLKRRLLNEISNNNILFNDLSSFRDFVWNFCRTLNKKDSVSKKFREENLLELPRSSFESYSLDIRAVNKYSMFSFGKNNYLYSVPSKYVGLRVEVRSYPEKIDVYYQGVLISSHKRLYGLKGKVSIKIEHIISALVKKPMALSSWKHKSVLFERKIWSTFYSKMHERKDINVDKKYLLCLKLLEKYDIDDLTVAMEIALEEGLSLDSEILIDILTNRAKKNLNCKPILIDLKEYDKFLLRSN